MCKLIYVGVAYIFLSTFSTFRWNFIIIDSEHSKQDTNVAQLLQRFYGKLTPRPTLVVRENELFDSALLGTEPNGETRTRTTESMYDEEE